MYLKKRLNVCTHTQMAEYAFQFRTIKYTPIDKNYYLQSSFQIDNGKYKQYHTFNR